MSAYSNPTVIIFQTMEALEDEEAPPASAAPAVFDTIADMLASNTDNWTTAWCRNIEDSDGAITVWLKLTDPEDLEANGDNILESADGAILLRTYP